ncbi:hypothetical protein BDW22DRAFT_248167 [Trametopsis cervina]|nr:hypothetical protein BDW22DRAFT_248167 [Trametopsis cervina]
MQPPDSRVNGNCRRTATTQAGQHITVIYLWSQKPLLQPSRCLALEEITAPLAHSPLNQTTDQPISRKPCLRRPHLSYGWAPAIGTCGRRQMSTFGCCACTGTVRVQTRPRWTDVGVDWTWPRVVPSCFVAPLCIVSRTQGAVGITAVSSGSRTSSLPADAECALAPSTPTSVLAVCPSDVCEPFGSDVLC